MDEAPVKQYVYHYHAQCQTSVAVVRHVDGITALTVPILTWDDYVMLKRGIDERDKGEGLDWIVCSLTLLSVPEAVKE